MPIALLKVELLLTKSYTGELSNIKSKVSKSKIKSPALIIIGSVVNSKK